MIPARSNPASGGYNNYLDGVFAAASETILDEEGAEILYHRFRTDGMTDQGARQRLAFLEKTVARAMLRLGLLKICPEDYQEILLDTQGVDVPRAFGQAGRVSDDGFDTDNPLYTIDDLNASKADSVAGMHVVDAKSIALQHAYAGRRITSHLGKRYAGVQQ